jgi:hypothetical protein
MSSESAQAAGGSKPTKFNTTPTDCHNGFATFGQSWIVANEPNMYTEGSRFFGYVKAFSILQVSRDGGVTWKTVTGSKRGHGRTRIDGSGASAFRDAVWGAWNITDPVTWRAHRVKTTFIWLNDSLKVVAKKSRVGDWYTTWTYTPGPMGPVTRSWTDQAGCLIAR